jgi:ribosomal protein S18 acetylase RimI-like enzyme
MMKVRTAKPEDLREIVKLNELLFKEEYALYDKTLDCSWPFGKVHYFRRMITDDKKFCAVALNSQKIVGYITGYMEKQDWRSTRNIALLGNIFVLKEHRRSGAGKMLTNEFIEWSRKMKADRMKVIAFPGNKNGIAFYMKMGFREYLTTLERPI